MASNSFAVNWGEDDLAFAGSTSTGDQASLKRAGAVVTQGPGEAAVALTVDDRPLGAPLHTEARHNEQAGPRAPIRDASLTTGKALAEPASPRPRAPPRPASKKADAEADGKKQDAKAPSDRAERDESGRVPDASPKAASKANGIGRPAESPLNTGSEAGATAELDGPGTREGEGLGDGDGDGGDDGTINPVDLETASGGMVGRRGLVTINPNKPFRILWETFGIIVIIWVTLSLPFKLAFLTEAINDQDPLFMLQVFVNFFFIIDVVLNFYTAYYDENDVLVTDPARIRNHYLSTWFAVDFLGAIPWDYMILLVSDHYYTALEGTKTLRILKLLRLFRLLRLHNLYRFFGRFEERLNNTFVKVFKLGITLILWLHLDACLFFFVARWSQLETGSFPPESWVVQTGVVGAPVAEQYLFSFWFVSSHMISISYGPINPILVPEVGATLFSMLCGAMLYASIIGTTASIIAASDPSGTEFYKQWDELKVYMRSKEIPAELRDRLRRYFNARWRGRKIFNEQAILSSLPEPYARSLLLHQCQWMLKTVPMLSEASPGFISAVVPLLQSRLVMEDEVLQQQDDSGYAWWIVAKGVVGLYRDGVRFAELDDGCTFGDIPFLFGTHSPFTVKTETPCQLYCVLREDFEEVFGAYRDLACRLKGASYKAMRRWGMVESLIPVVGFVPGTAASNSGSASGSVTATSASSTAATATATASACLQPPHSSPRGAIGETGVIGNGNAAANDGNSSSGAGIGIGEEVAGSNMVTAAIAGGEVTVLRNHYPLCSIQWDWEQVEDELQAEAAALGEQLEPLPPGFAIAAALALWGSSSPSTARAHKQGYGGSAGSAHELKRGLSSRRSSSGAGGLAAVAAAAAGPGSSFFYSGGGGRSFRSPSVSWGPVGGPGAGIGGSSGAAAWARRPYRASSMSSTTSGPGTGAGFGSSPHGGQAVSASDKERLEREARLARYYKEVAGIDEDYDILGKLKQGIEQAGVAIKKLPTELSHLPQNLERLQGTVQQGLGHLGHNLQQLPASMTGMIGHRRTSSAAVPSTSTAVASHSPSMAGHLNRQFHQHSSSHHQHMGRGFGGSPTSGDEESGGYGGGSAHSGGVGGGGSSTVLLSRLRRFGEHMETGAASFGQSFKAGLDTVRHKLDPRRRGYSTASDEGNGGGGASPAGVELPSSSPHHHVSEWDDGHSHHLQQSRALRPPPGIKVVASAGPSSSSSFASLAGEFDDWTASPSPSPSPATQQQQQQQSMAGSSSAPSHVATPAAEASSSFAFTSPAAATLPPVSVSAVGTEAASSSSSAQQHYGGTSGGGSHMLTPVPEEDERLNTSSHRLNVIEGPTAGTTSSESSLTTTTSEASIPIPATTADGAVGGQAQEAKQDDAIAGAVGQEAVHGADEWT